MKRAAVPSILAAVLLLASAAVAATQPAAKSARIGYLAGASMVSQAPRLDAFRQALRDIGYVEGNKLVIEYRYADGNVERAREFAAELVRLKVDVIVTGGPTATRFAKEATTMIPIVMAQDNDPVANGFISSLAHPGKNITGLSSLAPEIGGKRLEILKEIIPSLTRGAVFGQSTNPGNSNALSETELAAQTLAIKLQYHDIKATNDIGAAFSAANKSRAQALLVLGSPVLVSRQSEVVDLAVKYRLPATYNTAEFVYSGGLMTYGASLTDMHRRAAIYVDKILKGAKPADLPVEQPTKFELIINLKAAKQIGLTIPPNVLARADKVIR